MNHINIDNAPLTYVANSNIHGLGLFAEIPFLKGEIVLNYGLFPEIWYECLYSDLSDEKKEKSNFIMIDEERCITTDKKTKFGFVNHSRFPNCDYDLKNRLLIANRLISCNEEITIDYRVEYETYKKEFPDWI
jgi:SET domain-containing protein